MEIAAIQRTGLYFERGKPNESLGLGSPGQLAGGNEMKQSQEEKKQDGSVGTSHLGCIRKVIQRAQKSV